MTDPKEQADRLYNQQRKERGTAKTDKKTHAGPYVKTPERERRAAEIIRLRKEAARNERRGAPES